MDFHRIMVFLLPYLTFALFTSFYTAVDGRSIISNTEELQFRKPADPVKTIKTRHGDIYDCVDIYKQPAFDNPLLKDHKVQMNPSFSLKVDVQNVTSQSTVTIGSTEGAGCLEGTVPIRWVTKEELTSGENSFRKQFPYYFSTDAGGDDQPDKLIYAGYSTKEETGPHDPHYSAGGTVTVYNPMISPGQLSGSVLSVEGSNPKAPGQFSTIRVGWIVNPSKFGDGHTRLYAIWGQLTNGLMRGCYNTECPGFVQIDKAITLGMVFDQVTVPGGTQFSVNLLLQWDWESQNWWLIYGGSTKVGYWPSSLFDNLYGGANIIRWGGMVTSSTGQLPPMGSGKAADTGSLYMEIAFDDKSATSLDEPAVESLEPLGTRCYKVGDLYKVDDGHGYRFSFGGDGGDVQQCLS